MDNLALMDNNVPMTINELSKFVLIGREKLASVRSEIRAIQKVGLAKEVLAQKRLEAQEIAELVTLAEVRIGVMLREIPKTSGGDRKSEDFKNHVGVNFEKSKSEIAEELGFNRQQVSQFQQMAEYESVVLGAIAEAKEKNEIITRASILHEIDLYKHKPHVSNNSGNNEWYTPCEYIEAARKAMGSIDLDPASSDYANEIVKANVYYTIENDGLAHDWHGNVWLNPPYASNYVSRFIQKLLEQISNIHQAIVLVNNATETEWFCKLVSVSSAMCFLKSRIKFYMKDGLHGSPLQGQVAVYVGDNSEKFINIFKNLGWGCYPEWNIPLRTGESHNMLTG